MNKHLDVHLEDTAMIKRTLYFLPLFICLMIVTFFHGQTQADAADDWWDESWPYRVQVDVSGQGVAAANINFTNELNALGLNHALLDLRSIRIVPYTGSTPGNPLPYAESYSTILHDGETANGWSINDDGNAVVDNGRFTQGTASVKTTIINTPGGYGYPGTELRPDTINNWQPYESLIYDIWPQVNDSARDQAPDLFSFKLYNACGGGAVTQGGPPMALDQWNYASVSLHPLDTCWPADGLDLGSITRMEFHTRDNETVNGNSGLWDDGDILTLWFDNMRLVDQDNGAVRWQTTSGATRYYIYFDVLTHEGHPQPTLDNSLGSPALTATAQTAEVGGYYHQISGITGAGNLQIWAAPTAEKILKTMVAPVHTAPLIVQAAHGEFEPFQIVVRSPMAQSPTVSASSFSNGSDTIPAPTLHRVDYVNITTVGDHFDRYGQWPDPLWPLNNGEAVAFPANENQPLWFTVQVPWDAPAGTYQGSVNIGGTAVPVELEVWDFSLPRTIHLDSEWGFGWSSIIELYRGTIGGSVQPCYWDLVDAFKQDFIDHRLIPKGVAWPAGLNYPGGIEYDCNGNLDPGPPDGVWEFTYLGGKYIHGQQGFNDGYGFPAFLSHGPQSNWPPDSLPYSFCGVSRDGVLGSGAYQAKLGQYFNAVDSYITSANYDNEAYYHIVNEPQTHDDYTIVGQVSAFVEASAPHLRQLVSEQVEPAIYNYPGAKIDIWMPTITNYEPIKSQDRQKNHGEDVWWYYLYGDDPPLPNPILMSHPGIEARITPWLAWAERIDGLLHYSATDWSPNPWDNPNVTDKDNGDGFFFYPPRMDGQPLNSCGENGHRLVPSIRWENLRDGMEDYEYMYLISGAPSIGATNRADDIVDQIVASRTLFSRVPTDLANTRANLANAILDPPVYDHQNYLPAILR